MHRFTTCLSLALVACGTEPAPPTAASCAPICAAERAGAATPTAPEPAPAPEGAALTDYEQQLLQPLLDDLRAGVRPLDEQSVGICRGQNKCEDFLGTSPGELAPGDYILQAVLAVPAVGEGWKITLDTECTITRGDSTTNRTSSKDYELKYPGKGRGYRLVPLRRIKSPSPGGAQECTWRITAPHPDGDKVYEGGWKVPAAESP